MVHKMSIDESLARDLEKMSEMTLIFVAKRARERGFKAILWAIKHEFCARRAQRLARMRREAAA